VGELILDEENWLREKLTENQLFYTFAINDKEKLIDGKFYGNKSRFINHSVEWNNTEARVVYS
jgi:SET domain-containing protein